MIQIRPHRRWIALIAAYAVALQVLLPAAFAIASPADFPICSSQSRDASPQTPARHGGVGVSDCCGVMCHGPILAAPPLPVSLAAPVSVPGTTAAIIVTRFAPPPHRGPQSPRAPPAG